MVDENTSISWESVYKISRSWVDMLIFLHPFIWSRVSGLKCPTEEQRVCFQFCYDDATFLSRVITGDENRIYSYDPETKQQSSKWKMKSKVKIMLIIVFDIKGLFTKNSSWQAKQSIPHTVTAAA
jgi:hypothetical protein